VLHGPSTTELKPGIHDLLTQLKAREDVLLSLLTGNCESAARLKLSTQGLEHYFNFKMGAFGDRAKHRDELPAIAVEKAKHHHGHHFLGKSVVVIGDTPSDVRCVEALGARIVAVATGSYSVETLKAEGPDFLFRDLSVTSQVLSAILSPA
jgi:phosphoglycolate phosphatase-like HAD superfamily hydrolase